MGCDSIEVIGVLWCPDFIEGTGVLRHTLCTLGVMILLGVTGNFSNSLCNLGVLILQGRQVIFKIAYVT